MKSLLTSFLRIVSSLLILFIMATGCTTLRTYPGPQLPSEKVAKLKGTYHEYLIADVECVIVGIDGESIPGGVVQFPFRQTIEMLPGKHQVTLNLVLWHMLSFPALQDDWGVGQGFSFVAKAGHVYKADGNWHGGKIQIWIIDKKPARLSRVRNLKSA